MADQYDNPERFYPMWVRNIAWAYTTEADCYGIDPSEPNQPTGWAIYDAAEDDPPIAVCDLEDQAAVLVWALTEFSKRLDAEDGEHEGLDDPPSARELMIEAEAWDG